MSMTFTTGTKVKFRLGSEPHTFSRTPNAIHTVEAIRLICDDRGLVTHSMVKLIGRPNEVGTVDLLQA